MCIAAVALMVLMGTGAVMLIKGHGNNAEKGDENIAVSDVGTEDSGIEVSEFVPDENTYVYSLDVVGMDEYMAVGKTDMNLTMKTNNNTGEYGTFSYIIYYNYDPSTKGYKYESDTRGEFYKTYSLEDVDANGVTLTLTAYPGAGYQFVRWEGHNGQYNTSISYDSANITVSNIYGSDVTFTAIFKKEIEVTHTIKVKSDPTNAGTAYVNGKKDSLAVPYSDSVYLTQKANSGYEFLYWTNEAGTKFPGNATEKGDYQYMLELRTVSTDDTYTAHYKSTSNSAYTISTAVTPSGMGTVSIDSDSSISSKSVAYGDTMTLTATLTDAGKNGDYTFQKWVSANGKTSTDNPLQLTNITESDTYTAVFNTTVQEENPTITVSASPTAGGSVTIDGDSVSSKQVAAKGSMTLKATANDDYKFVRWESKNGKTSTDNPLQLVNITESDTYYAIFASTISEENPTITVTSSPSGKGYVSIDGSKVSDGTGKSVANGGSMTLRATATDSDYNFVRWESKNGKTSTENPLQLVNITVSDTYYAVFNTDSSSQGIKVVASPASGGVASKELDSNGWGAFLKAKANKGYHFVYWRVNGKGIVSESSSCIVPYVDGLTYEAVFEKSDDYDAKTELATQSFYTDQRHDSIPDYEVTRQKLVAEAAERINSQRAGQYANSTPGAGGYAAVEKAKDIYVDVEVKEDKSALSVEAELVTTDGDILDVRALSDKGAEDEKADAFVTKKFGDKYSYEIVACKETDPPADYTEGELTLLWNYQNVEEKDNIYILCEVNGESTWVSGVIEDETRVKFSIPEANDNMVLTMVRVVLE